MEYVELLRAKRALTAYGIVVAALLVLALVLIFKNGPPTVHVSAGENPHFYLQYVLAAATIGPVILASVFAGGLDAEYKTIAITWTRPISRLALALRYIAVDAVGLLGAWAITLVAIFIAIVAVGMAKYITVPAEFPTFMVLAFGCAVMWYGLVLLLSTFFPGHGARIVGASWAYVFIVPGLSQIPFPAPIHQIMVALNYVNPLAYFGNQGSQHVQSVLVGTLEQHTVATWVIGIVAAGIAARIWTVREAPL